MKKIALSLLTIALVIIIILVALPIPLPVLLKYYSSNRHAEVTLSSCKKGDEKIYMVVQNVFMSSTYFYYTSEGKKIGSHTEDDAFSPNDPVPPVKLSEYTCTELRKRE